jgi:hypothetical protein
MNNLAYLLHTYEYNLYNKITHISRTETITQTEQHFGLYAELICKYSKARNVYEVVYSSDWL